MKDYIKVDGEFVMRYPVKTFKVHDKPETAPTIKVSTSYEEYAFYKQPFAAGGEGRMFAARSLTAPDQAFCIKEIRLRRPKKWEKKGQSVPDWADIRERAT